MESADTSEIIFIISSFENSNATGSHSITTDLLKHIKGNICFHLKEITNIYFATIKLKIGKINPVFKNIGDPLKFSNYRQISLLSNINKIFEELVYS